MRLPRIEIQEGSGLLWKLACVLLPRGFRFDLYSDAAREAMHLARVAVSESRGQVLSPPHLLVGILRASPSTLERFMPADASASALATELLQGIAGHEPVAMSEEVPFSREARRVLRTAGVEAARSGHAVGPEHLLLGLLGHAGGVTGDLLRTHGVRDQTVRSYLQTSKDAAR